VPLRRKTRPAEMAVQLFLHDLVRHGDRVEIRRRSHLVARHVHVDAALDPVDAGHGKGREFDQLSGQPVPRRYDEIADVPFYVVGEDALDMAEVAVGRMYGVPFDVRDTPCTFIIRSMAAW